jgi:hypothetical protein
MQAAQRAGDDSAFFRWTSRTYARSPEELALALIDRPSFRRRGMESVRALLAANSDSSIGKRGLNETRAQYRLRSDDGRRSLLAALGRALVAEKQVAAGLDTLNRAARGTWNRSLFRALRDAYGTAGDSAGVTAMNVRLSVDPRTNVDSAALLTTDGRKRLGAQHWDSLAAAAKGELHARLLERASITSLRQMPTITDSMGASHTLRSLSAGRPAAVIIWSQNSGAAIERLPEIQRAYERLAAQGTRVFFVADEGSSAPLRQTLKKLGWKHAVYFDTRGELVTALTAFGTPGFYVLDGAGRIRFDFAEQAADVIGQMEAVASEGSRK